MYLAYKYARKKYRQRQEEKAAAEGHTEEAPSQTQDGVQESDETRALRASTGHDTATHASPPATGYDSRKPGPLVQNGAAEPKRKDDEKVETPEQIAEKKARRKYRAKIILGLFLPFTLQALDTTIIASALKFIADDFNQLQQLNWIITAFNLTSASFLPIFAQLADVFGRHAALQTALAFITVGSAICTGSPTSAFPLLLFGRALQGVGAAGINMSVRTILADRVSLADYAKNWTVFAFVSGISFSVGPVAGGYLTQVSWRWCFGINLPVAVAGILIVVVLLRKELLGPLPLERVTGQVGRRDPATRTGRFLTRLGTLDYGGQLLFLWGFGLLVLAFTWAGGTYPWGSAQVLAPLVIGAVVVVAWFWYEWAMVPGRVMARVFPSQKAMMPWQLLTQRDIGLLVGINFANGSAMFAIMYFMDLYFTLVQGNSSSTAGIALLYFLPGLGVGSYSAMFFLNVKPRQTFPVLLFSTTCAAVGITVMPYACHAQYTNLIYGMMALTGFGVGLTMSPGSLHALAYFPAMTAPITCLSAFAFPFGGTLTLTIMSTVFNNRSGDNHADPKTGIVFAYVAVVPFMWLSVLATTFLGNVWIGKDGHHQVVHGSFFWNLLRGRRLERVTMTRDTSKPVDETRGIDLKAVPTSRAEAPTDLEQGR